MTFTNIIQIDHPNINYRKSTNSCENRIRTMISDVFLVIK